ncbi:MAG: HD domain-containing protein [Acholeplasmataceae bacterium]
MNENLKRYLNETIMPIYESFDEAHRPDHIQRVLNRSLSIAKDYDVDYDMVKVIAIYHDIGMMYGRSDHHETGARYLLNDATLRSYFSHDDLVLMSQAIEDHRASRDEKPRSIYGRIIAEADRDLEPERVLRRTVQYGISHFPDLTFEQHLERLVEHMERKYGERGYLRLWLDVKENIEQQKKLRALLKDRSKLEALVKRIYDEEVAKKLDR